ncbi:hypothetical protein [Proteiniphilum acetatigenes]|uniref:hypothetical protein n=1 Tax=Proteiniphilum acetatigenes TaxID=294710 RepID=UPI0003637140|nr:hypothetical protein [Proteiniphilum acetatigenes]
MKKVILSVAIIAGMLITTNVQQAHAIQEQPTVAIVLDDDGFVDVQLQDLSEAVQAAISAFTQEYDIKALKYNAEKQLTKVKLTKKDDQSERVVYLDAEGKEVEAPARTEESGTIEQETPSAELSEVMQDNGFVNVKFEELNEKVQNAIRTITETYDVTSLRYNTEQGITEVKGTSKTDQSEKVFYLNGEGEEVAPPASQEQQQQEETEEVPMSL